MVVNNRLGYLFVFLGMSMALYAQRKTEVIRYGDLDQWVVRKITESAIIGKETKTLYCVGPMDTIIGNKPFEPKASPWGSSNVMARVSGITKASVSVYPERRDEGVQRRKGEVPPEKRLQYSWAIVAGPGSQADPGGLRRSR